MPDWPKRFDGQLQVAPPVSDSLLNEVPAKRGIFALLDKSNRPIVLLTAANIRARLRGRLSEPLEDKRTRTVDLREITRTVVWKLTGWHFETELEYFEAARRMWPDAYSELLAWRPGWFVHADPQDEYPRFVRTRDPADQSGVSVGPFPNGRSADRFIDAIADAFELCRHYRCLRLSPHGERCAYAQMGRCLSACDGTISMADYRQVIAEAGEFAAGSREKTFTRLGEQMADAAAKLEFERAGSLKARLDRLGELTGGPYVHVAPIQQFHYLLVQPDRTRKAKVFCACGGQVSSASALDYPLKPAQVQRTLRRMAAFVQRCDRQKTAISPAQTTEKLWRMGLVAHYLFCSDKRRGLIWRWRPESTPTQLAEAIEAGRDVIRVRAPKPRKSKKDKPAASN